MPPDQPRRGRRPGSVSGMGSVLRRVNKAGYVSYKPRVVVDGITYWGEGVGVRAGVSEARAKLLADQNRKKLLADLARNEHVDQDHRRATLAATLADWWRAFEASGRQDATKRKRAEQKAVLEPHVGTTLPRRVADLRPAHVRDLHARLREQGRASSTVRGVHDLLLQVLRWASRQGLPVHGPILEGAVERPGHQAREKRSVSVAEAHRLIGAMKDERPFGPLVALLYYQGLRDSEASGLKWGDVGIDGIDVKRKRERRSRAEGAPKHDSAGWVPLLPQAKAVLDEHRRWCERNGYPTGPDDWVFGHRSNKRAPIRPPIYDTTWAHIKDACKRAKLSADISAHSLRHGFADAANEAGVTVRDLAELLRNDPAVALRYQHRDVAALRRASERISGVMGKVTTEVTTADGSG